MYDFEKPSLKNFLVVVVIFFIVIALSWIAYYKFHMLYSSQDKNDRDSIHVVK